ncbi:MAG: hypothetical protein PF904_14240 [Kiritimatiellae bacterium]|nr:hypothetical protein [Kiritimatiellia bacterium]
MAANTMSFEASRKAMLKEITKVVGKDKITTKKISFQDNGLSSFLNDVVEFEKKSRSSTFMCG